MSEITETIVATSRLSGSVRRVAEMLAASPTMQDRACDPDQVTTLDKRIWYPSLRSPDYNFPRPAAVVSRGGGFGWERDADGEMLPKPGAWLRLVLTDWDRHPTREDLSWTDFENFCGGVVFDLARLSGQENGDYNFPEFEDLSELGPSAITDLRECGSDRRYWIASYRLVLFIPHG
jgi:hypothetical protein